MASRREGSDQVPDYFEIRGGGGDLHRFHQEKIKFASQLQSPVD